MSGLKEYLAYIDIDLGVEEKENIVTGIFKNLFIFTHSKGITPDIYLALFKSKKEIGFVGELLERKHNIPEDSYNHKGSLESLNNVGIKNSKFFENLVAAYGCMYYWKYLINKYDIPKKLLGKEFKKDYFLFDIEKSDIAGVKQKLEEFKELFNFSNVVEIGENSVFIDEFEKLQELEKVINSISLNILADCTKESIKTKVQNALIPQLRSLLKYCFDDIATYVITPNGVYGDLNKYKGPEEIPVIDFFSFTNSEYRDVIKSMRKYSILYWNMALGANVTSQNIDTTSFEDGFSMEFRNKYGSNLSSEKLNFPFEIDRFFEYFSFPYMSYKLITRNAFKIEETDNKDDKYKIVYDDLKFESSDSFFACLQESYIDLISILISNFILTTSDLNNCSLTQGQQEFRKHLKNLEQQESEKGIELIDTIIDRIIEKLEMIMYSLSDLEKGSKICNIDIIASLYPGKSKDNIIFNDKGETKGDSYFTTTKGLKLSSGTFSDVRRLAENKEKGTGFEVFRGIYTTNAKRESNELLFAYKKYDSLFYNNKPLGANFILGRDEETRMPVTLPLNVPQNIITTIIAGSGAGKGVLTLAALANLYVGGHSVIYADFKPDMGATLWDMSRNADIPIYSIDGKDLSTSADITPYGGKNNEWGVSYIDDSGQSIALPGRDWHGYDSHKYPEVQTYMGLDAVKIIPYLKTMQLFVALGLARKSSRKKLKDMHTLKSDGSTISDNGKKMFLILDEAQLANTIYDSVITDLFGALKNKENSDSFKFLERFKYVFIDRLAKEMKDVVITTGRVSKMGIILIGQQVDPGQWATPQGSWKECTFGYMVGNAAIKLIGNNGGTSPTYGMPAKFAESKTSEVGKTLGYWAYSTQVRSGKDEKARGLKTYLILNKNDYNVAEGPEGEQDGEFTAGLFTSRPDAESRMQLAQDLTTDDSLKTIRENVGFDGMLKQFLNTGKPLDANGYSEEYKDKVSYTYYLYESFLVEAGIIGPNTEYPNLFSYLYSVNPDSFYTASELYESFKQGKAKKLEDATDMINVFDFLVPFAKFEDKKNQGVIFNDNDEVIGLNFTYDLLKDYADSSKDKLDNFYKVSMDETTEAIKQLEKDRDALKKQGSLSPEEKERLAQIEKDLQKARANLDIIPEQQKKDLAIFKAILEQTSKEKFNKYPIDPEYIKNPNIDVSSKVSNSSNKPAFSISYKGIIKYVEPLFYKNADIYFAIKASNTCLEERLRKYSEAFVKKGDAKADAALAKGKVEINIAFDSILEKCKDAISVMDASDEDKNAGVKYAENIHNTLVKEFMDKFETAFNKCYPLGVSSTAPVTPATPTSETSDTPGTSDIADTSTTNITDNTSSDSPDTTSLIEDGKKEDNIDEDSVLEGRVNELIETYRNRMITTLTEPYKDLVKLKNLPRTETNKSKFKSIQEESSYKFQGKYLEDKEKFFTKLNSEITVLDIRIRVKSVIEQEYDEKLRQYQTEIENMIFESSEESGKNGGKPAVTQPKTSQASMVNGHIESDISTDDITYNVDDLDDIGNIKAVGQISEKIIQDIKHQYGGMNNIKSIVVNANGALIVNQIAYKPKFSPDFVTSLGLGMQEELKNGKITSIANVGMIIDEIMGNNIYSLSIEDQMLCDSVPFQQELGIKNYNYGSLFRQHKSLQVIYLPNEELTRNNPQSANRQSIGGKLSNLFGFGRGDRGSAGYVPSPAQSSGPTLVDRMFDSKPVRILTGAFGWTMGIKAVTVAATLFGPWGLIFGGIAAASAYKEIKNDRNNYKTSSRGSSSSKTSKSSKSSKPKSSGESKDSSEE